MSRDERQPPATRSAIPLMRAHRPEAFTAMAAVTRPAQSAALVDRSHLRHSMEVPGPEQKIRRAMASSPDPAGPIRTMFPAGIQRAAA
jgi:hypothetical protein